MGEGLSQPAKGPFSGPALATLIVSGVFAGMATVGVAVLLPVLQRTFAATPNVDILVQLCGGLTPAALAVGAPFIGRLVDKSDYRRTYVAGLVAFALFGCLPAVLDNLYLILVCRALLGISAAAVLISSLGALAALPDGPRARALGLQTLIAGLGAILVYPIVGLLAQHGWRFGFLIHGVSLLLLPLAFTLPKLADANLAHLHGSGGGEGAGQRALSGDLIAAAMLTGMVMFIGGMMAPLALQSIGVAKPELWALPPMVGGLVGLGVAACFGWLHARLSFGLIFALSLCGSGVGLLICGLAGGLLPFVLGAAVQGAGMTLFSPAVSAAAIARAGPGRAARAVGFAQGALFCSQVVFPFISAPLTRHAGIHAVYFLFGALALVAGLLYFAGAIRSRAQAKPGARSGAAPVRA